MGSIVLTGKEWKSHLQYQREKRQEQLNVTIEECQRLQHLHRQLFNRQFQTKTNFISRDDQRKTNLFNRSIVLEDLKPVRDYTSLIQRRLSSENDEHQYRIENNKCPMQSIDTQSEAKSASRLTTRSKETQRRLSVSTVDSKEKRAHKVFEKWPDYNEISQIVGFRIDPPKAKLSTAMDARSTTKKRNSSSRLIAATKQITRLVNLNTIASRRSKILDPSIDKLPMVKETLAVPLTVPPPPPPTSAAPRLPSSLCPSSLIFSQRIQTRQWLLKNNFAQFGTRTCPLL